MSKQLVVDMTMLKIVDELCREKASLKQLAEMFGISEKTAQRKIEDAKQWGVKIEICEDRKKCVNGREVVGFYYEVKNEYDIRRMLDIAMHLEMQKSLLVTQAKFQDFML